MGWGGLLGWKGLPRWLNGKESASTGDVGSISGSGRSPAEEMATQSSFLAWEIPWTEEPGGLQSVESRELNTTEYQACTHMLGWKRG